MSQANGDVLLDFSHALPQKRVRLRDGNDYPLRLDLEYTEQLRMVRMETRFRELTELEERTEQEEAEVRDLLRRMARSTVEAPPELLDQLTDTERTALWGRFWSEIKDRVDPTKRLSPTSSGSGDSTAAR